MTKIFISYRRQDTKAIAGRIFDRLEAKFGRDAVFMDIDSIPPGVDFHDWLNDHVAQAAVVLALIGPGWADERDDAGNRRLDNPNDFVRIEIEAALSRNIPLVPLLIDGAPFPPGEQLPESLRPLTRRNAAVLDAGRDFNVHIARLIEALERHLSGAWAQTQASPAEQSSPSPFSTYGIKPPLRWSEIAEAGARIESDLAASLAAHANRDTPAIQYEDAAQRLVRTFKGHFRWVNAVAFSPNGSEVVSAAGGSTAIFGKSDNTLKLWDAASGRELRTLSGHTNWVLSAAFSPDGRTLASGSPDTTLKLWDAASGRELRTLAGHTVSVNSVTFSPDGRTLASASHDNTIKLWDAASGRELRTLTGHSGVYSVAFSPDGRMLASASNQTLKLWDTASGRELRTLTGHTGNVYSVAFSPDGHTLASASWDRTLKLWDAASGRELCTLTGHTNQVNSVAFSPDGHTLASASWDNTLKLWDVASGRELRTLAGHTGHVTSVAFSPDGRTLASASHDTTLKLWDVSEWTQAR
jgi:WD40 repeat protein